MKRGGILNSFIINWFRHMTEEGFGMLNLDMMRGIAALGALAVVASGSALAADIHNETASFGTIPITADEWSGGTLGSFGFSAIADEYGRTVATAEPVALDFNGADEIRPRLWLGNDADLYQITVTKPFTFGIYSGGGLTLALFDATGTALKAGVNLTAANPLTVDAPGTYYIGQAIGGSVPQNAAGQALFDVSTTGVVLSPEPVGDLVLASDPTVAWSLYNAAADGVTANLIGPGNFTAGSSTIFNVIPSPAAAGAGLVMLAGLAGRRRRA